MKREISSVTIPERDVLQDSRLVVPAGPGARRLARELGVEITEVKGTGNNGYIREQDVKYHVKHAGFSDEHQIKRNADQWSVPDFSEFGPTTRVPLTVTGRY